MEKKKKKGIDEMTQKEKERFIAMIRVTRTWWRMSNEIENKKNTIKEDE